MSAYDLKQTNTHTKQSKQQQNKTKNKKDLFFFAFFFAPNCQNWQPVLSFVDRQACLLSKTGKTSFCSNPNQQSKAKQSSENGDGLWWWCVRFDAGVVGG